LGKVGDFEKASIKAAEGRAKVDRIKEITEKWVKLVDELNTGIVKNVDDLLNEQQSKMLTVVGVVIIIGIGISIFMSLSISKPIIMLTDAANKIANGDLSQSIKKIKTGDEIESLSETFDIMGSNLKNLIQKVNQSVQLLVASSEQLAASSKKHHQPA
jgi:methyl-accepting chemotaxis protein